MVEEETQRPVQEQELEFAQALAAATPSVFITPALIAINVAVFAIMAVNGVSVLEPTISHLIQWGADYGPLTTHGQWWRVLSSVFVHVGLIHLLMNMVILLNIGMFTERLFGNIGFSVIYLLAGIGGSLVSLTWRPFAVAAGASGAIFGLYGALLGFLLLQRRSVPRGTLKSVSKGAMIFLGYNLLYGMGKAEVDVAAHLGGLATGFCAGCAIAQRISGISKSRWRRSAVVALCGVVIAINCGAQIPVADDLSDQAGRFAVTETRLLDLYNASVNKWKADQLSSEDFARILEKQLLPPWRAEREAFRRLKHLPEGQQRIKTTLIDYMTARTDAWSLLVEGARSNDVSLVRKAIEKQAEAEKLAARIAEMTK